MCSKSHAITIPPQIEERLDKQKEEEIERTIGWIDKKKIL